MSDLLVHTSPQAEQFVVVPSCVSHPLSMMPSQSALPELHAMIHVPFWQTNDVVVTDWQTKPQLPQLLGSVERSTSHGNFEEEHVASGGTHLSDGQTCGAAASGDGPESGVSCGGGLLPASVEHAPPSHSEPTITVE
jgi:hypothetical protein